MAVPETVAFLVQRLGPYHHARLEALAAAWGGRVHAVEFRPSETVYAWGDAVEGGGYQRTRVSSRRELLGALAAIRPGVVVCVGYSDPEIHAAAAWALGRRIPLVACSDSTFEDKVRSRARESLKRSVLSAFDAALVSGTRARDYLRTLGVDGAADFRPWDVVDNAHFEHGAEAARRASAELRSRHKLPGRYFLCVARFVAKKNLGRLIEGYARYADYAGGQAWSLVLAGSGPLEPELRSAAAAAGVEHRVVFAGLVGYADLPAFYALAEAFILPSISEQWGLVVNEAMASGLPLLVSNRCGCAPDLLDKGGNGFSFDPDDGMAVSSQLERMARIPDEARAAMGRRSREIIARYSPEAFARGLIGAISHATAGRRTGSRYRLRTLLEFLALRRVGG